MNEPSARSRGWVALGAVMWALAMGSGLYAVWRYETTPGEKAADAPEKWPTVAGMDAEGRATVVMLAHPKCPCTRASIGELHSLFTELDGRARGFVLFMVPRDPAMKKEWEASDSWKRAAEIPGVTVLADEDGAIAARFGAKVSGHTVAYDHDGKLVFAGGITAARGHMGDNAGKSAILELLDNERSAATVAHTPTFGCGLSDPKTGQRP